MIRPSALGDVARTVPCLVSLRRAYPEATIDWLVDARFADAVRGHPDLDHVVPFERDRTGAAWPMLRRLRRAGYDLVFDLQGLARSGLFAWATRARARVGLAWTPECGWLGLNRRHRIDPSLHAAERMLALLTAEHVGAVRDLTLHVPPEDEGFARQYTDQVNALRTDILGARALHGRYACVAPTAKWGCKCWPIARYAELTRRLLEGGHVAAVVVIAAPHEHDGVRDELSAGLPDELIDRVWFTQTTVGQAMDLIRGARLLVGNDSAPLHLAVGLGTPTVSIFGPTDPARVGPPPPESPADAGEPGQGWTPDARHRVVRAPSAVGRTINYRRHRHDDSLIAEVDVEAVWEQVCAELALST